MILGRVVGEVWATRRHASLEGQKLLVVQPTLWYDPSHEVAHLVAVDTVRAGIGDHVIVCMGEPARRALGGSNLPVEAAICGVVDRVSLAEDRGRRPLAFIGPPPPGATP